MYDPNLGRFLQTDPTGYRDDINLYGYVGSDPVNSIDPTGLACVWLNTDSPYCSRADRYGELDGALSNQTRFFAAASATVQSLASSDYQLFGVSISQPIVSAETSKFMTSLSAKLERLNMSLASKVKSGAIAGPDIDRQLVRREQNAVQAELSALLEADPAVYRQIVSNVNDLLNGRGGSGAGSMVFGTDRAYSRILDQVRSDLRRDIDFEKQSDREAIGNALIDHVRRTGGCDIVGSRIKSC